MLGGDEDAPNLHRSVLTTIASATSSATTASVSFMDVSWEWRLSGFVILGLTT